MVRATIDGGATSVPTPSQRPTSGSSTSSAPKPRIVSVETSASQKGSSSASSTPKPRVEMSDASSTQPVVSTPKPRVASVEAPEPQISSPTPSAPKPRVTADDAPKAPASAPTAKVTIGVASAPASEAQEPANTTPASVSPETPAKDATPSTVAAVENPGPEAPFGAGADEAVPANVGVEQRPIGEPVVRARKSASEWVHQTFPGHEHAFWGGVIALAVALLVFVIGIWRVLIIGIIVLVGVALGQMLDGDPKIINAILGLFENGREQRF